MKFFFPLLLLLSVGITTAKADSLRLRDGVTLTGRYLGGTQTDVWFQQQGSMPDVIPIGAVEALTFGPVPIGRPAASLTPAWRPSSTSPSSTNGVATTDARLVKRNCAGGFGLNPQKSKSSLLILNRSSSTVSSRPGVEGCR